MTQAHTTAGAERASIEQAKREISGLIKEIRGLVNSEMTEEDFYAAFLSRVVTCLAAFGGAIWVAKENQLRLAYQVKLRETGMSSPDDLQSHGRLIERVFQRGEAELITPHSGLGDEKDAGNPTDYLLVLHPLVENERTQGVLEIFQRPGANTATQRGYLQFMKQMSELAAQYLRNQRLRSLTDRQSVWSQLERFTRVVHRGLDIPEIAFNISNEGRRLIECDRVSVAVARGRKMVTEAVSGQDTIDRRSNTVYLLDRLATTVASVGEEVWYTGETADMPPQIEEAVQEFVDETHSKTVVMVPLRVPQAEDDEEEGEVIGTLIVEDIDRVRSKEGLQQRVDAVAAHSATAMANALEHNNLFLMPVWRTLGRARVLISAKHLPKTVTGGVLLLAAVLSLIFVQKDFDLKGEGRLQPAERRDVFAAMDGVVEEVKVKHGQEVQAGDPLVVLRNTDLEVSIEDVQGRLAALRERIASLRRSLIETNDPKEKSQIAGQLGELNENYKSLRRQLDLLRQKDQMRVVASPVSGQVVTWDVEGQLKERPVGRGQVLLSIANPNGPWQLEVEMPDSRMGYIAQSQRELGDDLPVNYVLATDPGNTHQGSVAEVHSVAEVKGEEGNTVLVKVDIDKSDLNDLRPGASVTANVHCGRESLGFVWFHDLLAWLHKNVLFRF